MMRTDTFMRAGLDARGFDGFLTFKELREGGIERVPTSGGVYVVLRERDEVPAFLHESPGGRFKRKDPTVSREVLVGRWVEGAHCVYIGKGDNLRRRLKQFMHFGAGKPVGHWGGPLRVAVRGVRKSSSWRGERSSCRRRHVMPSSSRIPGVLRGGRLPIANISG